MISNRQRLALEQQRDRALLAALSTECRLRREQAIEQLRAAKAAGDLVRYQQLTEEWRRHPRVFGAAPPPV
jgi:hypothetical protein